MELQQGGERRNNVGRGIRGENEMLPIGLPGSSVQLNMNAKAHSTNAVAWMSVTLRCCSVSVIDKATCILSFAAVLIWERAVPGMMSAIRRLQQCV